MNISENSLSMWNSAMYKYKHCYLDHKHAYCEIGYRYLSMIKYPPKNLSLYVCDKLKQKQKIKSPMIPL